MKTIKILLHKNEKDFRQQFAELSSILVLALLSVLVFSGLLSASNGMNQSFNKWDKSSNIATEWITVNSNGNLPLSTLKDDSAIKEVQSQVVSNTYVGKSSEKKIVQMTVANQNSISKPWVSSGEKFNTTDKGIWVDKNFAEANHYKVGANLPISINGVTENLKIKGLILSPNYIGYTGANGGIVANHRQYGYVLTNKITVPFTDNMINQILVIGKMGYSSTTIKERINRILGNSVVFIADRTENSNISKFLDKAYSIEKLSMMFCIILFALVILTLNTTMKRLVSHQRNIIGLFGALGIKKTTIVLHYLLYGLIPTALGGMLGLVIGPLSIGKLILIKQRPLYNMPFWSIKTSIYPILVFLILVLVGILTTGITVSSVLRETPAQILQPKLLSGERKKSSGFWTSSTSLKWDWRWVLRDKSRSKSKELIGIIGILGALILIIASLGIQYSLTKTNNDTFGQVFTYKNQINVNPAVNSKEYISLINSLNGDQQEIEQQGVSIISGQKNILATGTIMDNGIYLNLPLRTGAIGNPQNKNGVYISNMIATQLGGIKVGTNIRIRGSMSTKAIVARVLGIVQISTPQGVFISKNFWKAQGQNFVPTTIYTSQTISKKVSENATVLQITSLKKNLQDANQVLSSFQSVIMLLIVFSIFLCWFILYNLGMLNFTERYREYATMRIMGFQLHEIRMVIMKDSLLTWGVGSIIGIPMGLAFLTQYVSIANSSTSEFFTHISLARIFTALLIVFINVLVISLLVSSQVKKIDLASALKSVD